MGANYKVREVVATDSYSFPDKDDPKQMVTLMSYELKVDGPQFGEFDPVTMTAKRDLPIDAEAITVGDDLFVDVKKNTRGDWKLIRAARRDRDNTPVDSKPRAGYRQQDPPEVVARIGRAHAQQIAVALIAATGDAKDLDLGNAEQAGAYLNGTVKKLIDWFAADVDKAGTAADV